MNNIDKTAITMFTVYIVSVVATTSAFVYLFMSAA